MNNAMKNIADLYPLSPMQQGMLFHSLAEPESGVYVELLSCTLKGRLNPEAFTRAWQRVMQRHPVLRTAMLVSEVKEPVQVVYRTVSLPIRQEDWRSLPAEEQQRRLEAFHQEEQARGFQLATPPLMRLALLRLGDDAWQFVWTYHHVLLDGWSTPIVFQEVMAFYQAFAGGHELHLELPPAYRDYIVWLRKQDMGKAEAYWRKALAGFTAPTPLTVPHPAPEPDPETPAYAEREVWLPEAQVQKLQAFARQHNLTLNSLVSGAWAVLLARYSGEEEVCFGATVSGRPPELPGSEGMVGLFINTLPVRVQIDPRQPIAAWLRDFQARMVEMRQYEYSPLVDIHRWSQAPAGQPLFESILVYENFPIQKVMSGGESAPADLQIERMHSVEQTNFPLTAVAGAAGELMLKLVYDTSMFSAGWIERMLSHWSNLITAAAAQPDTPPVLLPLLTPAERQQVLVEFNNHRAGFPADRCAHDLFAAQAARFPTAPAIDFEGEVISYGELNARANRLAHYLQSQGIAHGSLVGLCFRRSPEMVIGMLGVLKAGAAYVPLDPAYPADRLAFMIEDSGLQVLLSTTALCEGFSAEGRRIITLDEAREAIEAQPAEAPTHQACPNSLAYVIYTSGSTGKPKGVLLNHRGLCNLVTQYARAIDLGLGMRMLQFFSYSFDGSVADIFVALTSGAALCLGRAENLLPGPELVRFIRERGVTHGMITPSALAALPQAGLPSLRVLLTGGEACSRVTVEPWLDGRRVINAYGPTENTVISTLYEITDLEAEPEVLPIGRPLTNTTVYILDPYLNPVPAGVAGEVYVGGVGIAQGYLNRPELTAERFLPDPFSAEPGARMYKTGDVGRFRADGSGVVEYLGRSDDQVKVRGFRIELGEIEAALSRHERVAAAVMAAVPEPGGDPGMVRLAAYVVSKDGDPLTLEEARAFLRKSLPEYMLPAVLAPLESLPLLPSGKVNRRALAALALDGAAASGPAHESIPPRSELEAGLCAIWEAVLNRRPVGVTDNFFDLGGHSLLAVRVVAQMKEKLGVELPLVVIFQHPTVEQLAIAIQKQSSADETAMLTDDFSLAAGPAGDSAAEPQSDGEEASSIVPLRQGGSKPALFFVHPSGGSTHWYTELADALGGDQPFYGIQARGVMGDRPLHTSITEMAAYYVRALRQAQPQGPYYLGSWSLGVIIVYEMAQQLAAAGEQVALLAMLDQGPEMPLPKAADDADYLVQTFGKNLKLDVTELRRLTYRDQVAYVLEKGKRARWIFPDITPDAFFHFVNILRTHGDAWRAYQPQPYPGKVTLFRAKSQEIPAHLGPDLGWCDVARGGVEVIEVPGNHLTMIHKPHVRALAKKLRETIDQAQSAAEDQPVMINNQ